MTLLLRGQDAEAQKEFAAALKIDGHLKADLDQSIAQILSARKR